MKLTLHKYQKRVVKEMVECYSLGLFLDPGLGKTVCALTAFKKLKQAGNATSMLVICPPRTLYSVWPEEIKKWSDFKGITCSILHGPNKNEALKKDADVYLINPEGLQWLYEKTTYPFDMLVVDESHKFKNWTSKRTKILKKLLPLFDSRYILTGTPTPKNLMDLFSQVYILDKGDSLGHYITGYRNEYFYPSGYGGYQWTPNKSAEKKIAEKIEHLVVRMDAKDYLNMPQLTFVDHYIDLPREARRKYNTLKKEFLLQLRKGVVTAGTAAVLTGKLRQMANGGIYLQNTGQFENVHYEKSDYVAEIVEELSGQQALISYEFRHDLSRLKKALKSIIGYEPGHIGGDVTAKDADRLIEAFNAGDEQIILGQPESVAHGLNLQAGNNIVYHSLPWSLGSYQQFYKRSWRQGQDKPVIVHRLLARDTVDDQVMLRALKLKDATQETLFSLLKKSLGA